MSERLNVGRLTLKGVRCLGSLNKVVVGILDVKLELRPKLTNAITEEILTTQHSLEKTNRAQRERLFITYAKRWWDEYLQIRDTHSERLVKIFARVSAPFCVVIVSVFICSLLCVQASCCRLVTLQATLIGSIWSGYGAGLAINRSRVRLPAATLPSSDPGQVVHTCPAPLTLRLYGAIEI